MGAGQEPNAVEAGTLITIKEEFLTDEKTIEAIRLGGYEALAMWLALKGYAARKLTDGFIPDLAIDRLPGAPKHPRKALRALVECGLPGRNGERGSGLVDTVEHGWQLHDYLDHANPASVEEERRRRAREKKRQQRDKSRGQVGTCPGTTEGPDKGQPTDMSPGTDPGTSRDHTGASGRSRAPSPAQPPPEGKDPPTPGPRRRDPFDLAKNRPDVRELFEAWKRTFGYHGARLDVGSASVDADMLAERIDAHGMAECLRVLAYAPNDGMVSGRDDERRQKHDTVRYIFGNHTAFQRLQRDASKHRPDGAPSVADAMARLREAEA